MSERWRIWLFGLLLVSTPFALDFKESGGSSEAATNEWAGFNHENMGLTQWEFQQVKNSGMSKEKLLHLLEIGIRPTEYLQKPWERLKVTEQQWLDERAKGMEDSDIDRSYRYKGQHQHYAYLSLLVPSLYQWKVGKSTQAISMDVLWAVSVGATIFLTLSTDSKDETYMYPFIAAVHVWSFADGLLETQWENNPDANRFSWGFLPIPQGGVVGMAQWRF